MSSRDTAFVALPPGIVLPYYADLSQSDRSRKTLPANAEVTNFVYTNASGELEIPMFLRFTITTNATAGNRIFRFLFQTSGGDMGAIIPPTAQPPSSLFTYYFSQGLGFATAQQIVDSTGTTAGYIDATIPPLVLYPNDGFIIKSSNPGVGDALGIGIYDRISVPTIGDDQTGVFLPQAIAPGQLT